MTPDGHYIYAVDFDGTLIHGNKWPDVDGEVDTELIKYLIREQKQGAKIILNTCRTGEALQDAVVLCMAYGLEFDAVNENLPEMIKAYGSDCRKISADRYIDDKAINPDGVSWSFFNDFNMSIIKSLVSNEGGDK